MKITYTLNEIKADSLNQCNSRLINARALLVEAIDAGDQTLIAKYQKRIASITRFKNTIK